MSFHVGTSVFVKLDPEDLKTDILNRGTQKQIRFKEQWIHLFVLSQLCMRENKV